MSYLGLPPTSAAFVTDTFSGTGSQTDFTMSVAPASTTSMLVVVGGVLQDPANYAIVGMTLRFSTAPPAGTGNISVRYMGIPAASVVNTAYRTVTDMTATAGQTTFTVPGYTVGFIDVFRNGVRLGNADFSATSGVSVVLAVAANANDLITTVSFSVGSVLNAIPNTAGSVTALNLAPGAARSNFGAGAVLQVVSVPKTDVFTTSSTSFVNVTGLSATISLSNASNKVMIICNVALGANAGYFAIFPRLARNNSPIFVNDPAGSRLQAAAMYETAVANTIPVAINYMDSPGTLAPTTYSLQVMTNQAAMVARVNASGNDDNVSNWSRSVSAITLMEIAA